MIRQAFPYTDFSADALHSWDGAYYGGRDVALIRFDGIFGTGANHIRPHEQLVAAHLVYKVAITGSNANWHEVTVPWSAPGTTWNSFVGTTGLDNEIGPLVAAHQAVGSNTVRFDRPGTLHRVDVLSSLLRFQSGAAPNYGWAKVPNGEHQGSFYGCNAPSPAGSTCSTMIWKSPRFS